MPDSFARALALSVALLAPVPFSSSPAADVVVYENDFNAAPGSTFPGWTSSRVTYKSRNDASKLGILPAPAVTNVESPRGQRRFLGEFGGPRVDPSAYTRVEQAVRLTLNDLPAHDTVTVSFDLLILKSWDGNSPRYGPDRWSLKVVGGKTLFDSTFSNNPKVAAEGSDQNYPRPKSRFREGAVAVNALGYEFFGDSTYRLKFTFPHRGPSLALAFLGDLFEGKGLADESWGLDDVKVVVSGGGPTPVASP